MIWSALKLLKKIIGNSENLNLKEFSKFASDPQKFKIYYIQ